MKLPMFFHRPNLKKGILFVLIGWFCFSTMYLLSKLLQGQTTVPTMLFFRNLLGLAIASPWILKHWPKSIQAKNWKVLVTRSFSGLFNLFFVFLALEKLSLVDTTLLNNTAPFFVPFILWFWLKVPINNKLWPAIIIGFIGIALILHPDRNVLNMGAVYALISAVCLALSLITMRLTTKGETLYTFLLYYFAIGAVATLPFAIFDWRVDNFLTLIGLIGIGLFSFLGQIFLYYGLKEGKASQLAPFTYSVVVFSGIYEWFFFRKLPPPVAVLGLLCIVAAGIWVVHVSPPVEKGK